MAKKSKSTSTSNITKEQEALNKPVDMAGGNVDPAINALVSEDFIKMSNFDATEIALILQDIVRGQASLLSLAKENSEAIVRLKERQDKIDMETIARMERQRKEIEEIMDQAESLKATGIKKDQIVASGVKMYQEALQNARASKSVDRLAFEKKLAAEAKETVVSPGQLVTVREGQQIVSKIIPEEVRIKHKLWLLQPGVPTVVPQSVADALRRRRTSQEQTTKLQNMLGKHMEANKLAQEWNKESGSGSSMPIVPGSG